MSEMSEMLSLKLHPARFSEMSGKMAALVGYILDEEFSNPLIVELLVTPDGYVLARNEEDLGFNNFIGAEADLRRNWVTLLKAAELTPEEYAEAEQCYRARVKRGARMVPNGPKFG
jgi:hypothetical protein